MTTAILDIRPFAHEGEASSDRVASNLVRLFALDQAPARSLVCHWRRDTDGQLVCRWEPDLAPVPQC